MKSIIVSGKKRVIIPFRFILRWLVRLRRSPRAIAGGFALGTFIAMTPTFGIQLGIAVVMATMLNVNRPAAILTVWITNVATIVPIYTFNYWVGTLFLDGPAVTEVYKIFLKLTAKLVTFQLWEMFGQFKVIMGLSKDIIIPLCVGSILVGLISGLIVYLLSMAALQFILAKYRKKKGLPPSSSQQTKLP